MRDGRLPVARGVALTGEDRLRRDVIEQLMCRLEVDLGEVAARHGVAPDGLLAARPRLGPMEEDGLAVCRDGRIRITEEGRPFVRAVAAAFDSRLAVGETRHSAAI